MVHPPLLCPIPVGREEPLRRLVSGLDRAVAGHGGVFLIGGEAGIGKTRLVRELKPLAGARGARIVEGRCSSAESSVPYAPLMDALRFRLAQGEGDEAARMLGPLRAVLAPLFPQLRETETVTEQPSERPFELILRVLERLSTDDAMLLVLEDIHAADPTSLELLRYLAHRIAPLRLFVVATYRSDELHATHPLRQLLATLARERSAEELCLAPLDRRETAEMLHHMLDAKPDPAFAEAIWRRTEGNPFFIEELVMALAGEGVVTADALARVQLPVTVREAGLARVRALGARALETMSAAAVIGRHVDADVLREVLGVSEEELVEILEQLVAHQLLREEQRGRGDCYTFPHALTQEALYANIISRRRRLLHRQVAMAFERRPGRRTATRLAELAYHYRLGGDHERAHEYAMVAGDEAARLRAWDDAGVHYEHALEALEEIHDDGPRAAAVLERLADVAWRQGRGATCRQYAEEAHRLLRALGRAEDAARVLRRLAALRAREGDHDGATSALTEALELLADHPDSRELGPVYDDLGQLSLERGELANAERLLVRGLALATRDSEGAEEVLALVSLGELGVLAGEPTAGISRLDLALELLREGRLPFERLTRVYAAGAKALLLAHEYERALRWAEAGRAVSVEQGVVVQEAYFRAIRAAILTITCAAEDTIAEAEAAVSALRRTQGAELRVALRILGFTQLVRGELAAARRAYTESRALGEEQATLGLGLVALAEGRVAEAATTLEEVRRALPASEPLLARRLLPYVVEALIAATEVGRAVALVRETPAPDDIRAGGPALEYATGLVLLAEGRAAEARDALQNAAATWSALGDRLEAVRARVALLEASLAAGEPAVVVSEGRALLEELERMTLPRERQRVRRILRRVGVRTPPGARDAATHDPHALLTGREQTVLREIALGRTNREIAAILGISEKTVGVHVSHILAKLHCRTRTQAARFATP